MPNLSKLPVPQYDPNHPYHWEYDNLPLKTLEARDELINGQLQIVSEIVQKSAGSEQNLSERLNVSLEEDGNLKKTAIDDAMHNISDHADNEKEIESDELDAYINLGLPDLTNPVKFVRMLDAERTKLASIAPEATDITFSFETASNIVVFEGGIIEFKPSTEIEWTVESPNIVKANLRVSLDFAHRHYNDQIPVSIPSEDLIPVDYKLFKVNSSATPYVEDSLKIYVNGIKLTKNSLVYYPDNTVSNWILNKYTEDFENGTFLLYSAITEDDVIVIDYDILLN